MKYVQKERGVVENEMGGESQEEHAGKKVSGLYVCAFNSFGDSKK